MGLGGWAACFVSFALHDVAPKLAALSRHWLPKGCRVMCHSIAGRETPANTEKEWACLVLPTLHCEQHQNPGRQAWDRLADTTGRTHAGAFCVGMLKSLKLNHRRGQYFAILSGTHVGPTCESLTLVIRSPPSDHAYGSHCSDTCKQFSTSSCCMVTILVGFKIKVFCFGILDTQGTLLHFAHPNSQD